MHDRTFARPRGGRRFGAMQAIDPTQRVADLRLRGASSLPVRVRWPAHAPTPAPLVVFLPDLGVAGGVDPDDERLCHQLCAGVGAVVLCAPWGASRPGGADSPLERAAGVLEWSADHAGELAGDPDRLLLAGSGAGVAACVALALRARERGWPRITRQLLVLCESASRPSRVRDAARSAISEVANDAGIAPAPATVAVPRGRPTRCAERLRARGIDVDELALEDVEALWRSLRGALGTGT
jgi:acetyl esterase/lipase